MARLKLTDERATNIVNRIWVGHDCATAARCEMISPRTFWNWWSRGEAERKRLDAEDAEPEGEPLESEAVFLDFYDRVEQARGRAQGHAEMQVYTATSEDWRAAAWYLERVNPKRWGTHRRVEMSGPDGGPVEASVRGEMSLDFLNSDDPKVREALLALSEAMVDSALGDMPTPSVETPGDDAC